MHGVLFKRLRGVERASPVGSEREQRSGGPLGAPGSFVCLPCAKPRHPRGPSGGPLPRTQPSLQMANEREELASDPYVCCAAFSCRTIATHQTHGVHPMCWDYTNVYHLHEKQTHVYIYIQHIKNAKQYKSIYGVYSSEEREKKQKNKAPMGKGTIVCVAQCPVQCACKAFWLAPPRCSVVRRGDGERDASALLTDLPQQEPGMVPRVRLLHNTVSHWIRAP